MLVHCTRLCVACRWDLVHLSMGPERSWVNGNVFSKKREKFNTITAHYGRPWGHSEQELCMSAESREACVRFHYKGNCWTSHNYESRCARQEKKKTPTLGSLPVKMNTPVWSTDQRHRHLALLPQPSLMSSGDVFTTPPPRLDSESTTHHSQNSLPRLLVLPTVPTPSAGPGS